MMMVLMNKRGRRSLGELFDVSPEGGQDLKTFDMDAKNTELKIGDELTPAYKLTVVATSEAPSSPAPSASAGGEGATATAGASGDESIVGRSGSQEQGASSSEKESAQALGGGATGGAENDAESESAGESARSMEKMRIELVPEGTVPAAAYCVKRLASSPNPTAPEVEETGSVLAVPETVPTSGSNNGVGDEESSGSQAGEGANFAEASASLTAEADAIGGDGEDALDDVQADAFAGANPA
jgi:hypothetical protein